MGSQNYHSLMQRTYPIPFDFELRQNISNVKDRITNKILDVNPESLNANRTSATKKRRNSSASKCENDDLKETSSKRIKLENNANFHSYKLMKKLYYDEEEERIFYRFTLFTASSNAICEYYTNNSKGDDAARNNSEIFSVESDATHDNSKNSLLPTLGNNGLFSKNYLEINTTNVLQSTSNMENFPSEKSASKTQMSNNHSITLQPTSIACKVRLDDSVLKDISSNTLLTNTHSVTLNITPIQPNSNHVSSSKPISRTCPTTSNHSMMPQVTPGMNKKATVETNFETPVNIISVMSKMTVSTPTSTRESNSPRRKPILSNSDKVISSNASKNVSIGAKTLLTNKNNVMKVDISKSSSHDKSSSKRFDLIKETLSDVTKKSSKDKQPLSKNKLTPIEQQILCNKKIQLRRKSAKSKLTSNTIVKSPKKNIGMPFRRAVLTRADSSDSAVNSPPNSPTYSVASSNASLISIYSVKNFKNNFFSGIDSFYDD